MKDSILEIQDVSKSFSGVYALKGVRLTVKKGEVHALIGENGAGKSTLMKIILGMHQPNEGSMLFKGETYAPKNPMDALQAGVSMIHQEISLADNMTVAENIWVGREPTKGGFVDYAEMNRRAKALLSELNLDISPSCKVKKLKVAQQQMVEIARAISYDSDLIIMDEPTSALTEDEVKTLFSIIRNLKKKQVTVIIITHKLNELFEISDSVTVLRDGEYVGCYPIEEMTEKKLVSLMVGRELNEMFPKQAASIGGELLSVKHLTLKGVFEDVSFTVRKGEILGVAGLMGAGRSEIMLSLFGAVPPDSGEIFIDGKKAVIRSPRDAIRNGIAMVTEDRKLTGLSLCRSCKENMSIAHLKKISPHLFLNEKKERREIDRMIQALSIKLASVRQAVSSLSGGNQQKIVLARWLLTEPRILILDEPTRGIDVGAKAEIHRLISELTGTGMAVIMISSELPEILGMSDRILVVHNGRVSGELTREEASQERIMEFATNTATKEEKG